jgi:dTDP-4-dehydrorhamnose 3,5-epimerase
MDQIVPIEGVILSPLKKIENPLGNVFHGLKKSDIGFYGFEEAYFSTVNMGVIKPWKKHLEMTLNLIVPIGLIKFVLYDDRKDSKTKGKFMDITLSIENYYRLTIPPKIWVAFKGVGKSTNLLLNVANLEHNPKEIVRADINKFDFNW